MALSKQRRPVVLITGEVIGKEPKQKFENGRATGEVARWDVTILQPSFATPDVRFPLSVDAPEAPEVGEKVALIVDCGEYAEYGASFRVIRYATDDDLESIAKNLRALAK